MQMSDDHRPSDDVLFAELSAHFARTDGVPDSVLDAARAAIEVRHLDAQLAELLADTAMQEKELAGVRGVGNRLLSFGTGERFVEVDVAESENARLLNGYVVPASDGVVHVEHKDGETEAVIDHRGRFRVLGIPRGPVRLRVVVAGLPPLLTPWLTL
jgi:hypothetical protein